MQGLFMYVEKVVPDFRVRLIMQTMWKKQLFSSVNEGSVVTIACDIIDDHRRGNPVSLDIVRNLINSIKVMDEADGEYEELLARQKQNNPVRVVRRPKTSTASGILAQLGKEILSRTENFYKKESSRLTTMTPGDAIGYVNECLTKEADLLSSYLYELKNKNHLKGYDELLNKTIINDHLDFFMQGFDIIVVSGDVGLGRAIHDIFKRVRKLKDLAGRYSVVVKKHIEEAFEKDVETASKDCHKFIEIATSEYKLFRDYGKEAFGDNVDFSDALNESMIAALNDNAVVKKNIPSSGNVEISKNIYVARVFSQYIHLLLMSAKDNLDKTDLEKSENDFIDLYKFLKSKKDFLERYKDGLARRLLRHETGDNVIDLETGFLEKLKKVKGEDILSQCTNMIADVLKSEDQAKVFEDFSKDRGESKCPVVPLLCSSAWPIKLTNQALVLPKNMATFASLFTEYFNLTSNKDGKKSLLLMHQYGRGDIFFFSGGVKNELKGTELHLVILPMIKSTGTISFKQIADETKIPLEDLKSQLAYLITNGFVLVKNNEGDPKIDRKDRDTWVEGTLMKANPKFSHPKKQKKFTLIVRKDERSAETSAVTKEELRAAFEGYKTTTEANVVRIMKTRKDFSANELYSETMKAVSRWFSMDRKVFSAALTDLIDQEIIKRLPGNKVEYIG